MNNFKKRGTNNTFKLPGTSLFGTSRTSIRDNSLLNHHNYGTNTSSLGNNMSTETTGGMTMNLNNQQQHRSYPTTTTSGSGTRSFVSGSTRGFRRINVNNGSVPVNFSTIPTTIPTTNISTSLYKNYIKKNFMDKMIQFMSLKEITNMCEDAPFPIYIKNEENQYVYVNKSFYQFLRELTQFQQQEMDIQNNENGETNTTTTTENQIDEDDESDDTNTENQKYKKHKILHHPLTLQDGKNVVVGIIIPKL